jgi:HNH endonuclease
MFYRHISKRFGVFKSDRLIESLVTEINSLSQKDIVNFHQQPKTPENMAIKGERGTLYIQPNKTFTYIDICLYGISIEKEMFGFMVDLCGKSFDSYKHLKKKEPYWRVGIENLSIIRKAAYRFAGLDSPKEYFDISLDNNIVDDIQHIIEQTDIETTERDSLIQSRIGQGKFRENLIKLWQECSVTGYKMVSLLVASHIKPWAYSDNKERLDPFNGLLLLPNIDKAFDMGYISFDKTGKILISKGFVDFGLLGIRKGIQINIKDGNIPYLEYHRTHVFKS